MKNLLFLFSMVVLMWTACTDPAKQKQEAIYLGTKAQSEFLATNYEQAIELADASLKLYPDNTEMLFLKAKSQNLMGNVDAGIALLSDFIKEKPQSDPAYAERSLYYLQQKNYEKALEDIQGALKNKPKNKSYLEKKGLIEQNMGNHQTAIATFSELILLDGTNARAYFLRALSKKWKKDYKDAFADLEIAADLEGNKYDYNEQKAFILVEIGYPHDAISTFGLNINMAMANETQDLLSASFNNRGNVYTKIKKYDYALADFDRAERAFPDNSYTYRSRALVFLAQNEPAKACEELEKAKNLGFSEKHGSEVSDLISANCQ